MNNLIGCQLIETLRFVQAKSNKIIKVVKLIGNMNKFGELKVPYVVHVCEDVNYITLYVTYY